MAEKLIETKLGVYQGAVDSALLQMRNDKIISRVWDHDYTVWKPEPDEVANRLGWLHCPEVMVEQIGGLEALAAQVVEQGYTDALLLGMGGSSLAPEVLSDVLGGSGLRLAVLDSTDPGAVLSYQEKLDPEKTLFIVSTKSGGTVETLSFMKSFFNWTAAAIGLEKTGDHFIAITDPGSKLARLAEEHKFRKTILNAPNIGGRNSALSFFGLAPAALMGVDLGLLLGRAGEMADLCKLENDNPSALLGAIMGELALAGRDKLTFIVSPKFASFGDWVEQLVAESTGKHGKGILPVVNEPVGPPEVYGDDRLFVHIQLEEDAASQSEVKALENAGYPVIYITLNDRYDLGGQFFLWEMATALAGYRLGINPFNQPNVEAAKVLARQMVAEYEEKGSLPEPAPNLEEDGITLFDDQAPCCSLDDALALFLYQADKQAYIALQAFLQPSGETWALLMELRTQLRDRTRLATTLGYGPRFLHSTGQLHKGDAGKGLFIQFTADAAKDVAIPDAIGSAKSSITFGVLKMAQALGDYHALTKAERRVIRFHLGSDVNGGLNRLLATLS